MKHIVLCLMAYLYTLTLTAQNTQQFSIKDAKNKEPLIGANGLVRGTNIGATTDAEGVLTLKNIANGRQIIVFSYVGYETLEKNFEFPSNTQVIDIQLNASEEEIEELIIEGTRSNRSIENIPTRVEALTEEIDEASSMDPSKIAHLITHSTGIQVQQTSATSNTANVRIQGLDGRYTQILKDGFPIYGGFSGSLSIMQIPPLDLRQVEYIKGGASTLYGGGAIAGLINLILTVKY